MRKSMGQGGKDLMTAEEKSDLWDRITEAKAKIDSLRPFVDWLKSDSSGIESFFGDDSQKFSDLMSSLDAPYSRSVEGVFSRIDGTDTIEWTKMTDQESEDVDSWASAIDEMWSMYLEHKAPPEEKFVVQGLALGTVSVGALLASILLS